MRRRDLIALLGAVAWMPIAARGQDPAKRPRIAVLSGVARKVNSPIVAFELGMQELGYIDGHNIDFEYRYANGKLDQFPALAGELLAHSPDVIFAAVTPAAVAARELTNDSHRLSATRRSDRFWLNRKRVPARRQRHRRLIPHAGPGQQTGRTRAAIGTRPREARIYRKHCQRRHH